MGAVQLSTGDEIGKMAYGTGEIPFVRTSDLEWKKPRNFNIIAKTFIFVFLIACLSYNRPITWGKHVIKRT